MAGWSFAAKMFSRFAAPEGNSQEPQHQQEIPFSEILNCTLHSFRALWSFSAAVAEAAAAAAADAVKKNSSSGSSSRSDIFSMVSKHFFSAIL